VAWWRDELARLAKARFAVVGQHAAVLVDSAEFSDA